MTTLRRILIAGALLLPSTSLWGLTARITMSDGTIRTATFEGVGCSSSICSRIAIKGKANGTPVTTRLDSIAAIRDATADSALLVLKDGTTRRLTLVNDFRVIYLDNRSGSRRKRRNSTSPGPDRLSLSPHRNERGAFPSAISKLTGQFRLHPSKTDDAAVPVIRI